jgi:hypothetical protein
MFDKEKAITTPSVAKTTPDKPEVVPAGISSSHREFEIMAVRKTVINIKKIIARFSLTDDLKLETENKRKNTNRPNKLFARCPNPPPWTNMDVTTPQGV